MLNFQRPIDQCMPLCLAQALGKSTRFSRICRDLKLNSVMVTLLPLWDRFDVSSSSAYLPMQMAVLSKF